jgi:hypothetical protein
MRPSLPNRPSSKHRGICHDIIVPCMNVMEFIAVQFVQHKIIANFVTAQLWLFFSMTSHGPTLSGTSNECAPFDSPFRLMMNRLPVYHGPFCHIKYNRQVRHGPFGPTCQLGSQDKPLFHRISWDLGSLRHLVPWRIVAKFATAHFVPPFSLGRKTCLSFADFHGPTCQSIWYGIAKTSTACARNHTQDLLFSQTTRTAKTYITLRYINQFIICDHNKIKQIKNEVKSGDKLHIWFPGRAKKQKTSV